MDFLTGTIISGFVYDLIKQGFTISVKKIIDFFSNENCVEISNEQAFQIYTQIKDTNAESQANLLTRQEFVSQYENIFKLNTTNNSTNQTNIGDNNTNIVANNSPITFNQNVQKKTANYSN